VLAVDASEECLLALTRRAARLGLSNIQVCPGRLEELPLETSCCDSAMCRSALIYADDIHQALLEMKRVLVPGGRFSVFEPLPGEVTIVARGEGAPIDEELEAIERTLKERRASYSLERSTLRGAFEDAGFGNLDSLVMHFTVTMEGRSEEEIRRDYLWDLPGDLAAMNVLKALMEEERILEAGARFAREASAGRIAVRIPSLLVWGAGPLEQ
jgi:ubiquinone/menaquinone biosynthesis C-methylase UbiE